MRIASKAGKDNEIYSPLEPPEGPCQHLDCSPVKMIPDFHPLKCKTRNLCGFMPL